MAYPYSGRSSTILQIEHTTDENDDLGILEAQIQLITNPLFNATMNDIWSLESGLKSSLKYYLLCFSKTKRNARRRLHQPQFTGQFRFRNDLVCHFNKKCLLTVEVYLLQTLWGQSTKEDKYKGLGECLINQRQQTGKAVTWHAAWPICLYFESY